MVAVKNAGNCAGCLLCALSCSFENSPEHEFNLSRSCVKVTPQTEGGFKIEFTPECIDCGICAGYCYYDVLTL